MQFSCSKCGKAYELVSGTPGVGPCHWAQVCECDSHFRARASAVSLPGPWQPIETAPRDGRPILVFGADGNWYGVVNRSMNDAHWQVAWASYLRPGAFTHWMPLPEPPNA